MLSKLQKKQHKINTALRQQTSERLSDFSYQRCFYMDLIILRGRQVKGAVTFAVATVAVSELAFQSLCD